MVSGLYAIADSGYCPEGQLPAFARQVLEGGCRTLQLRMKVGQAGTADGMKKIALEILKLKGGFDFTFIINDHADLALEINADGVHVGANDEPVAAIRRRAGDRLRIGYSSHAVDEARQAELDGADYVAFGAIFPTKTKGPGHPVQGIARLAELTQSVRVPVVAIGGIHRDNVLQVLDAGAASVAMISALAEARDVVAETRWFENVIRSR